MNDREVIERLVLSCGISNDGDVAYLALINSILAYGEQVRREQRETDCVFLENIHQQPCICTKCQYYAEAAAAIRANDQVAKPKGENHAG